MKNLSLCLLVILVSTSAFGETTLTCTGTENGVNYTIKNEDPTHLSFIGKSSTGLKTLSAILVVREERNHLIRGWIDSNGNPAGAYHLVVTKPVSTFEAQANHVGVPQKINMNCELTRTYARTESKILDLINRGNHVESIQAFNLLTSDEKKQELQVWENIIKQDYDAVAALDRRIDESQNSKQITKYVGAAGGTGMSVVVALAVINPPAVGIGLGIFGFVSGLTGYGSLGWLSEWQGIIERNQEKRSQYKQELWRLNGFLSRASAHYNNQR